MLPFVKLQRLRTFDAHTYICPPEHHMKPQLALQNVQTMSRAFKVVFRMRQNRTIRCIGLYPGGKRERFQVIEIGEIALGGFNKALAIEFTGLAKRSINQLHPTTLHLTRTAARLFRSCTLLVKDESL